MGAPEPGREYPIKLGASMFSSDAGGGGVDGNGKAYFACHAAHMPEVSASAGALLRQDDTLSLRVPTTSSGDTGVRLTGTRRQPSSSAMSEYIFMFKDGCIYVERIADSFANIRSQPGEVTISPPSPRTPTPASLALGPSKGITKKRRSPSPIAKTAATGTAAAKRPHIAVKSVGAKTVPRVHQEDSSSDSDSNSGSGSASGSGSDSDSDSGSGESSDNDSVSYTSRSSDGE